ncbi:MAG: redoxin domain-containing protein [Prevotellaceae bacterium]|nr:redoxin domain-containing protein [Prevotellaceae bacterium]
MKRILLVLFVTLGAQLAQARVIELNFPALAADSGWLYTFHESWADSVPVRLDRQGKAKVAVADKNYRGMAYLFLPKAGGVEFILAEPTLKITATEKQINNQTVQFPQSKENAEMRRIFMRKAFLSNKQEWLRAGEQFVDKRDKDFTATIARLSADNEKALKAFDDSLKTSTLYAARYLDLNLFMRSLYALTQQPDSVQRQALQDRMEYVLDINALYTSGRLWTDVHSYYPVLFAGVPEDSAQVLYAASVRVTLMRLTNDKVKSAFLVSAISMCERSNYAKAQEIILRDFIQDYPDFTTNDPKLKRMLASYSVGKGSVAPPLAGLATPLAQKAILIFFDSSCEHCRHELDWIAERYALLTAQGYRVISIAADLDATQYTALAATFPWAAADRLCDYKAYAGDNFRNYGIIGTPTVFVIGDNGVVQGRYATMNETGLEWVLYRDEAVPKERK